MVQNETLLETVHTLLCDKTHANQIESLASGKRDKNYCYFYLEKTLTECYEMDDHVFWQEQAEKIKNDLKASNADDALRSIYKVLDMIEKLNQLSKAELVLLKQLMGF